MKIKKLIVIFALFLVITGCSTKTVVNQGVESTPEATASIVAEAESGAAQPDSTAGIIATATPKADNNMAETKATPTPEIKPDSSKGGNVKLLEGKIICIDPGHGNPDHPVQNEPIAPNSDILKPATAAGTAGVSTKVPEYKLTMAVSLKIRDKLLEKGAKVVMTRENNDVDLGNIERSEIANRIPADISVRIHADGYDDPSVYGISVLYPGGMYISNAELLRKSKLAAQVTLEELVKSTGGRSRGVVERNDLTGFNWSKVPVILVEMGFMTNPAEDERMNTDEYREKIAAGIVNGIVRYIEK